MTYTGSGLTLSLFDIYRTDNIVNLYSNISYRVKSIRLSEVMFMDPCIIIDIL